MNILKIVAITAFTLASAGAHADFMSSTDDGCKIGGAGCSAEPQSDTYGNWIDPDGTDLDGAIWIAPEESWFVVGEFSVWELDLDSNGLSNIINSLFVSYDDHLQIKIGDNVIWDSATYGSANAWTQVFDVIADVGNLQVGPNQGLNFYVRNTGGPTGVIWKGSTATAVPEPGTLALLGLGLAGLGMSRRKKV